jgi:hypothetical protein
MNLQKLPLNDGGWLVLNLGNYPDWDAETELELICRKYDQFKTTDVSLNGTEARYWLDKEQWDNEEFWKDITLWQLKY